MKKDDLFAQEQFLLKPRLGAVIEGECLALFELPFEWLDDFAIDAPIVIARNAVDDFRLRHAHMGHHHRFAVVAPQII
jgi:hypothetical protein